MVEASCCAGEEVKLVRDEDAKFGVTRHSHFLLFLSPRPAGGAARAQCKATLMPFPLPPDLEAELVAALTPAEHAATVGAGATATATAAHRDPVACVAWLTSCLVAGSPQLLTPSQRVVALAAVAAEGGATVALTLRALSASTPRGRLRLSPPETVLVDALLAGGHARAAVLAASVAAALAWRSAGDVGSSSADPPPPPPPLPPPIVPPPAYTLPVTRHELLWVAHRDDGSAMLIGGALPLADAAPLAHLLRRAADGVLPVPEWALANKLSEARTLDACAAAAAPSVLAVAAGVAHHMPALAGLATLAAAAHEGRGYGDDDAASSTPGATWAAALAGAPVSGAWAAAVAAVAAGPHPPSPTFLQTVLAAALHAVPPDPAAPDAGRAVRLAALLARTLRGSAERRAALEPLRPELEAFALTCSRYKEAADLYRDLKAHVEVGEKRR